MSERKAILALETTSNICSVAVVTFCSNEEKVDIYSQTKDADKRHSQIVLGMITDVLAQADIDKADLSAIVFSKGPGSFTGTRLGATIAKGMGLALGIPLIPVSTLQGIAYRFQDGKQNILVEKSSTATINFYAGFDADGNLILADTIQKPFVGEYQNDDILNIDDKKFLYKKNQDPTAETIAKIAVGEFLKGEMVEATKADIVYLYENYQKPVKSN